MLTMEIKGELPTGEPELPMEDVAALMFDSVQLNFESGGRPEKWLPLARGGESFLYQSGALRSSVRSEYGEDFAAVYAGAGLPYAAIHQYGGRAGRGGSAIIPQREYMLFQDEDVDAILEMLDGHLTAFYSTKGERIG